MDPAGPFNASNAIEHPPPARPPINEPEQLGSVTHSQDSEGSNTGLQIRSSARVSKKMRLDLITVPVSSIVQPEKKEIVVVAKEEEIKTPDGKPRRRNWELWSPDDKNTFFEALNEYGKDFDAIQNYFTMKARKKSTAENLIKNKDQIRHFYYRTWHKVSKHLKFSEDVKKGAQELYALVNYGELRKKLGKVNEKTSVKLNELIHKGFTQVRSKGKTLRIKTPLCRTLRKLNQLDECQDVPKLPTRVCVELRPRSNDAWSRVQATAHNPRIRTMVPLQKRLSSLLLFLTNTWKPSQTKLRDKLLSSVGCDEAEEAKPLAAEPLLRVAPKPGATICLPSINLNEYLTSNVLSLNSYEERINLYSAAVPTSKGRHKTVTEPSMSPKDETDSSAESLQSKPEGSVEIINKVRAGWTIEDANAVTVGEMYLMFGSDATLQLDYWWEGKQSPITDTLHTLLSIAKLNLRKARVECPCGHSCGGVVKPRSHILARPIRTNCEKIEPGAGPLNGDHMSRADTHDGVFVRPLAPGSVDAFKAQLDNFRPRYCNRRGRTLRPKNVVVQRMLPLLPKAPTGHTMVTVNVVPATLQLLPMAKAVLPLSPVQHIQVCDENPVLPSLPSLDTPVSSPPSISNLLDMPGGDDGNMALSAANNFSGLLSGDSGGVMQTPPTSPSRILKEADTQWLNSEVADFSLSSFLGHLDSPLKQESPRLTDVDTQLQCLMTENSVDYMAKFADLAAQIASNDINNKK